MKLIDLEIWLEELRNIIIDLNISINNAKYLLKEGDSNEEKVKKNGFFQHHSYQLKFIIVIQICKILENNDNAKRSVHKLFNRLENEGYDDEFKLALKSNVNLFRRFSNKKDLISIIKSLRIEIKESEEIISKVKHARDHIYAHNDPNKETSFVRWPDLELLVNLSSKIYNELYSGLHGAHMNFEWTDDWNVKNVVRRIVIYKESLEKQRNKKP